MKFRFALVALLSAALLITACGDKDKPGASAKEEKVQTAGNSEGSVVTTFYKAIEAGKSDDAMNSIALAGLPEAQVNEVKSNAQKLFAAEKAKIEAKGGIKSIDVNKAGEAAVNKNQTPFTVKITFGDGSTEEGSVNLIKDGSNWKISL